MQKTSAKLSSTENKIWIIKWLNLEFRYLFNTSCTFWPNSNLFKVLKTDFTIQYFQYRVGTLQTLLRGTGYIEWPDAWNCSPISYLRNANLISLVLRGLQELLQHWMLVVFVLIAGNAHACLDPVHVCQDVLQRHCEQNNIHLQQYTIARVRLWPFNAALIGKRAAVK